jgi:hypothetical protein
MHTETRVDLNVKYPGEQFCPESNVASLKYIFVLLVFYLNILRQDEQIKLLTSVGTFGSKFYY